ncbi:hypothetical protein [Niallia taxi]|uniref:hypothetical protein n=1 Tax=Niallia taxi TaxID=2499688 RepID=UPI00119CBBBA|nr:hypothetical protein [Niallia taxi]MCT2345384.1 hypothetical protein [Niallia taxi]MED3961793.1 hypothetical protein [Niallia taxi]
MYRFSIENANWILLFSPNITLDDESKQAIVRSILQLGKELTTFSHGESFVIMNKNIGLIVFLVEKIPSLILTVANIVERDKWYLQSEKSIKKYDA